MTTCPATYKAVKVSVNGSAQNQLFRAVGTIQWLKNGSVDGSAKFSIDHVWREMDRGQPRLRVHRRLRRYGRLTRLSKSREAARAA